MRQSKYKFLVLVLSSLFSVASLSACNDSTKANATNNNVVPASTAVTSNSPVALVTKEAEVQQRNHVCFTMDVNNVKCVLGDIVTYVPQPILEDNQDQATSKKDTQVKQKQKEDPKLAQQEQQELLIEAKQKALNDARPLVFAAKYCDLDKNVIYSKEGVSCFFKPHVLYDAGPIAEATQYQINLAKSEEFFKQVASIKGVEKFNNPDIFGPQGGYRIYLHKAGNRQNSLAIGDDTVATIVTKRIDLSGNVLGLYRETLTFDNLNAQIKELSRGLIAGDHVKLVFDSLLQNEQPLWRTSSLEFGQPYIWEVEVKTVKLLAEEENKSSSEQPNSTEQQPSFAPESTK